jgi:seryl-tRNA synthetase
MQDLQEIRAHPDQVRASLARRGIEPPIETLLALDSDRRALLTQVEQLKAERNRVSKEIGQMKDAAGREVRIGEMRAIGQHIEALDASVREKETALHELLTGLPNVPDADVPDGPDETFNVVERTSASQAFADRAAHWDLGPALGILDFDRGVKLTGSRFYVLSGTGARLQRALIAWMLDLHTRQGYLEKYTPFVVREETLFAAGQLPKFRDNLYHDHEENLWLVPTAEVPLTGLHMDEIPTAARPEGTRLRRASGARRCR